MEIEKKFKSIFQAEITINNIKIIVLKKDIKNLHLNVLPPDGKVRVSAPINFDDDAIRLFIISRLTWIKKQRKNFIEQSRETKREYITGESHYFKGKRYLLNIIEIDDKLTDRNKIKSKIEIRNKKYIDFYIKKNMNIEQRGKIFSHWYREEFKKELPDIFDRWQKKIGVSAKEWKIRKMKTKWGSCNPENKKILINFELIKKPHYCIEYIVAHELTHLLEKNHNKTFFCYMDKFIPMWRSYKKELNEYLSPYDAISFS